MSFIYQRITGRGRAKAAAWWATAWNTGDVSLGDHRSRKIGVQKSIVCSCYLPIFFSFFLSFFSYYLFFFPSSVQWGIGMTGMLCKRENQSRGHITASAANDGLDGLIVWDLLFSTETPWDSGHHYHGFSFLSFSFVVERVTGDGRKLQNPYMSLRHTHWSRPPFSFVQFPLFEQE